MLISEHNIIFFFVLNIIFYSGRFFQFCIKQHKKIPILGIGSCSQNSSLIVATIHATDVMIDGGMKHTCRCIYRHTVVGIKSLTYSVHYFFQLKVKRKDSTVNLGIKFLTYFGDSVASVHHLKSQQGYAILQSFLSSLRSLKHEEDFGLTAFNRSCIGIETDVGYTATLKVKGNS